MMTILIDDRAGSRELIKFPPLDSQGALCRLDSADVCFPGNSPSGPVLVGVEVKSIFDLVSSIDTGRLQATQVPAMMEEYDITWLLYYGDFQPGKSGQLLVRRGRAWKGHKLGKRPVPYGYVESFLLTLTALGMHVKRVRDQSEASYWIGVLFRWWSKPWKKHKGLHTFDSSRNLALMPQMDEKTRILAKFAAQFPGIGFERAVAVAKHFHSVEEMVNADPQKWIEIDGIGVTLAVEIHKTIRGL